MSSFLILLNTVLSAANLTLAVTNSSWFNLSIAVINIAVATWLMENDK